MESRNDAQTAHMGIRCAREADTSCVSALARGQSVRSPLVCARSPVGRACAPALAREQSPEVNPAAMDCLKHHFPFAHRGCRSVAAQQSYMRIIV